MPRSTPATRAGRSSTCAARGTASTRRSTRAPAATWASPSRIRATWRRAKKRTFGVAVGEMKSEKTARAGDKPGAQEGGKLGLAVRPLTPEEKKELGGGVQGLVVEGASGPAAKAGIRRGDLVTAVNG